MRWTRWKPVLSAKTGRSHEAKPSKSWAMAYCGIVAALCVALMLLGAVIPIAMFIAPAVAGFLVATVCVECGMQLALTAYAAVSLLALLFVPDKEVALIFVFCWGITRWQSRSLSASALRFCALSASCCCATAQCWPCTAGISAGAGRQHFAGAAHHRAGCLAGNAGHGQCCLCAV